MVYSSSIRLAQQIGFCDAVVIVAVSYVIVHSLVVIDIVVVEIVKFLADN